MAFISNNFTTAAETDAIRPFTAWSARDSTRGKTDGDRFVEKYWKQGDPMSWTKFLTYIAEVPEDLETDDFAMDFNLPNGLHYVCGLNKFSVESVLKQLIILANKLGRNNIEALGWDYGFYNSLIENYSMVDDYNYVTMLNSTALLETNKILTLAVANAYVLALGKRPSAISIMQMSVIMHNFVEALMYSNKGDIMSLSELMAMKDEYEEEADKCLYIFSREDEGIYMKCLDVSEAADINRGRNELGERVIGYKEFKKEVFKLDNTHRVF